ncbi:cytochrome P450 [Mycena amicta]|nr:cytochrome P450 [Mycena amicta]
MDDHLAAASLLVGVLPAAFTGLILLGLLISAWPLLVRKKLADTDGNPLPPGPYFRRMFLGKYNELVLDRWAKRFGPLYSVWFGDQLFVVVSHARVAHNLLVENGAIFSSRKDYFIKNEVILHDRALTANPYNQRWRDHRKMAMKYLSEKAVYNYVDRIESEAVTLLRSLYDESQSGSVPVSPALSAVRFTLNNMLRVSFGIRTTSISDPLLHRIQKLVMEFDDITSNNSLRLPLTNAQWFSPGPTSNAVDFIKPLRLFPTRTKTRAKNLNAEMIEVYGGIIQDVQDRLDRGEEVPDCLMKHLLEVGPSEGFEKEDILMLAVAFAILTSILTAGILQWFIAFMATHPAVAAAAHAELDQVVGRDRLPTSDDEKNLPYIRAIIKEVQRIHSPFWVPTPHYSTADLVYNGMFIPKGTVVLLNCWTIHHNEERYPDSYTFNPDRYIGDNLSSSASSKLSDPMLRDHWAFGAGRRICPGFTIAEREIWLAASGLLWAYTFHCVPEAPISLQEYEGASGRTPLPFKMKLTVRHRRAREIIEAHDPGESRPSFSGTNTVLLRNILHVFSLWFLFHPMNKTHDLPLLPLTVRTPPMRRGGVRGLVHIA